MIGKYVTSVLSNFENHDRAITEEPYTIQLKFIRGGCQLDYLVKVLADGFQEYQDPTQYDYPRILIYLCFVCNGQGNILKNQEPMV